MSSRRIRAMARLIEEMDDRINEWYRNPRTPPDEVIRSLAIKLAGYLRDLKGEAPPKAEP